jgi:PKD repeat protein
LIVALARTDVSAQTIAKIRINPPIVYKAVNQSLKVDINVEDAEDVYSWQINMTFNPDVLTFVNVTEGNFLANQPEGTDGPYIATGTGWALFTWQTFGAYPGASGTGTLGTVEFNVKAIGESVLNITDPMTKLVRIYIPPIPPGKNQSEVLPRTTENGVFTNLLQPPTADFTHSPSLPNINEETTFDASASSAIGTIVEYRWDFGDGTKKAYVGDNLTSTATHTFTTGGIFNVTLTVIDDTSPSDLISTVFGTATMPLVWYELYGTKTVSINIKLGHNVAVTFVEPSATVATKGDKVTITVTVKNLGVETETFDVKAYYGTTLIDTKQVADLTSEEERNVTFEWDTANVETGDHQIWAEAILEGDANPDNNKFTDGTVAVSGGSEGIPTTIIIAAVVGVVAVLGVGLFLFMRRRGSSTPPPT